MCHKERVPAFIGSQGVGKWEGAFPISRQTHRYQRPNLPHSHGSPETTQTPHFHNHSARLSRKQQTTPQKACLTHHTQRLPTLLIKSHRTYPIRGWQQVVVFSCFTRSVNIKRSNGSHKYVCVNRKKQKERRTRATLDACKPFRLFWPTPV